MKCRVKKFKRITIALLTFSGIYVLFMIYKLGTFDTASIFGGGGRNDHQSLVAPKTVYWNQPYWIIDDDQDADYQILNEDEDETNGGDDGVRVYPYKGIKSEILSIRRTLRDTRPIDCKLVSYSYELMPVSIVVVFHNEYIGVILRSLYSIVTNTPKDLINEIIYVDDASTNTYLNDEFDWYIEKTRAAIRNIHLIRLKQRLGANRAILEGIKLAKSDHVVLMTQVLDVNRNWLPPLLNPILRNGQTVTVPVHEFKHWKPNSSFVLDERGLFDLQLNYIEMPKLKEVAEVTNFRTPLIPPQGLFVINKHFLAKINPDAIGGQDGNLLELSLKVWSCGGRIVKVPCSRVSHNFKESGIHDSYIFDQNQRNKEHKTTIDAWFGEYKEIFLSISSSRFQNISIITNPNPANDFNVHTSCKSFKWFLAKVAPDLKSNFLTQPKVIRTVRIQNVQQGENNSLCLQQKSSVAEFLSLDNCSSDAAAVAVGTETKQLFDITRRSEIRPTATYLCWEAYNQINYRNVSARFVAAQPCSLMLKSQKFVYDTTDEQIHQIESDTCLETIENSTFVWLTECDPDKESQKWKLF